MADGPRHRIVQAAMKRTGSGAVKLDDDVILRTNGLSVRFGGVSALDDVNLSVKRGQIFGLLGPNGAGKTTLLSVIAGAERGASGQVIFAGRDITLSRPDERSRVGIARTFQITRPFEDLTVEENVMVGAQQRIWRIADMRADVSDIIDWVGLTEKRRSLAKTLSTGQRKRLELARALATKPSLLLMDEVTGGIDQPSIPAMIELVGRLRERGITVVIIEHNMRVITELCDRIMFLNRGKVMSEGAVCDVMALPEIVDLYLGDEAQHA
jgi:branched-chain amino acid transport system ATP-binding protein